MPKKMEAALKRKAGSKGLVGEQANAYTYGAMRKTGWKPDKEKKAKERQSMMSQYARSKPG